MTLSLSRKLFLSFLALTLLILAATLILARWSFNQGFLDYVNSIDQLRLQRIARDVVEHYNDTDVGWDHFSAASFDRIVERHWYRHPPPPEHARGHGLAGGPYATDHNPDHHRPPPPPLHMNDAERNFKPTRRNEQNHPRKRRGPALEQPPKTALFDQQGNHIAGDQILPGNDIVQIPVTFEETEIGYLQAIVVRRLDSPLATAFSAQQARASLLIGSVALLLAGFTSYLLTQVLRTPILAAISAVERLARGDYSKQSGASHSALAANQTDLSQPQIADAQAHPADKTRTQSWYSKGAGDELQRLHSNIEHLRLSLKEGGTARRRLLADISHELRTPLTILTGEIDALKDGLRAFDNSQLDSLDQEVARLRHLVEDLHQLSLSDVGGLRYLFEPISLFDCISTSVNALIPSAASCGLEIHFAKPDKQRTPVRLLADTKRLTQLFTNLISNSIAYTTAPGHIYISLEYKQLTNTSEPAQAGTGLAHIVIEDSAPAVAAEHHEQLFETFYREDESGNRLFGGAGLGLAICRNIVVAHRGTITASSSLYGGLRMDIKLPMGAQPIS